jgi:hypothetical protein
MKDEFSFDDTQQPLDILDVCEIKAGVVFLDELPAFARYGNCATRLLSDTLIPKRILNASQYMHLHEVLAQIG